MSKLCEFKEKNYPFIVLFIVALVAHLLFPLSWGDDAIFASRVEAMGFEQFISGSARPLTDSLTYVFSKWPSLWRLLNPVVLTVFAFVTSRLLSCENKKVQNTIICCSIIYPTIIVVDAGFVATTVNYLWSVTCGFLCLIPLKAALENKKVSWYWVLPCLPLLLYATNMQQMSVLLAAVFFLGILFLAIAKRKFNLCITLEFLITCAGLFYSYYLNMFGNNNRMERETKRYFPNFAELNIFEKAELGFSSTFFGLTMNAHFALVAFLIFSGLLAFFVFKKKSKLYSKIIAVFPFVFSLVFGILSLVPRDLIKGLTFFTGELKNFKMTKAIYSFNPVADILFIIICLCVIYSLFVLLKNKKTVAVCVIILALGLMTRMLMGFSPTVWASGHRTFFLMFMAFIAVSIIVINENERLLPKIKKVNTR
ncbi:MAG: hypothetical protein IJF40_07560 [Clostridia bacterium]|nr:hypothetical protein [Clostridia bacterium]